MKGQPGKEPVVDMSSSLTGRDLRLLIQRVFQPRPDDRALAIMVDVEGGANYAVEQLAIRP